MGSTTMGSHVPYVIGIHVRLYCSILKSMCVAAVCNVNTGQETSASLHGHGCAVEHCMGSSARVNHEHRCTNCFMLD